MPSIRYKTYNAIGGIGKRCRGFRPRSEAVHRATVLARDVSRSIGMARQLEVPLRKGMNDLSGKEWLQLSRSWWFQRGLGREHPDTRIELQHPAPFSFLDIQKLVCFFTKPGMTVLDPFCGIGSTLKAAALCGRHAIGIELSPKWASLAKRRISREVPKAKRKEVVLRVLTGDCLEKMKKLPPSEIDFIVTSPPYWGILNKDPDHKVLRERVQNGLATRYTRSSRDLGNIKTYEDFLRKLRVAVRESKRVLRAKRYMAWIVGDFRHGSRFYPLHSDLMRIGDEIGLRLSGILILIQNGKQLYPYGYPHAYVQNIHHQYAIIFRKD